ncbi:hypothetical protein J3458_012723 [Metarhizium acridum]|uniref:uncharacterized protein n=1 Tax=Metarhizium acridum TaxID=92637 RepID=UPI001C6CAA5A|nr:hypothetical protein J3458_012723 [Metarhizium acridum]
MAGSSNTRAMAGRETTPGKRGPSEVLERQELQNLVRIASDLREKQSLATQNNSDLSDNDDDPRLDPTSETFDHYRWAQRALTSLNNSGITLERQGVVFSNLSVSGSGSPLRFPGDCKRRAAARAGPPWERLLNLLKALCGHLEGLTLEPESDIHYQGIGFNKMTRQYRGEVAYNQEVR